MFLKGTILKFFFLLLKLSLTYESEVQFLESLEM